jgi:hypothetical protein
MDTLPFHEISHDQVERLLNGLRDLFQKYFLRKHLNVQPETRVPFYDKPFLEMKKQCEKVGILLQDIMTSPHPQNIKELLQIIRSIDVPALLSSRD